MKIRLLILAFLVLLIAAWWWSVRLDQAEIERVEVMPEPAPVPMPRRDPTYPVEQITIPTPPPLVVEEEPPTPEPQPILRDTDAEVLVDATELFPDQDLAALLVPDFIISRIVSTVDSLDARRVAIPQRPFKSPPGRFAVLRSEDQTVISPANAERYAPYVDLILAVDTAQLVTRYVHYYPLLQEAYLGLGDQEAYFNDRMVEILDLLLATPEPVGMIELVQNEAIWEFADPDLESLAVGQKALLRLSPEDRRAVKTKFRELRDALSGTNATLETP